VYDIVILGGGPGGYAAALYAWNFGLKTALVSNEPPGGTCLLRGCIPAKQWLQVAEVFSTVRHAADFGVVSSPPTLDWGAALSRKTKTVETLVRGLSGLLKQRQVEVLLGKGRLAGPGSVVVTSSDGERTTLWTGRFGQSGWPSSAGESSAVSSPACSPTWAAMFTCSS